MTDAKKREQEDIRNILKNADEMLRAFKSRIENKQVIIFLGNTRNGKSTLVSYITDAPLVAIKSRDLFKIEHENGENINAAITHGSLSHTAVPNVVEMNGRPGTILVDAPGFDDNRGVQQEIINALYINQIKYAKGVRFVLVVDINSIINDNINSFLNFMEIIHTIMPEFIKLRDAVSIIFTKDHLDYELSDIVDLLRRKFLDVNGLHCKKDLIGHFVNRKDLIGLFKMPTEPGPLRKEINVNVNEAIFGGNHINLSETDIKFGISGKGHVALLETYMECFDLVINIKKALRDFIRLSFGKFSRIGSILIFPEKGQLQEMQGLFQKFQNKIGSKNISSAVEIPQALEELFVIELNLIVAEIKNITKEFAEDACDHSDANFNNIEVEQLEYIVCIEKILERNVKSETICEYYKNTVHTFIVGIQNIEKNIDEELSIRKNLALKIKYLLQCEDFFTTINESCLSQLNFEELQKKQIKLVGFQEVLNCAIVDISKRRALEKLLTMDIGKVMFLGGKIQNQINAIVDRTRSSKPTTFVSSIKKRLYPKQRCLICKELDERFTYLKKLTNGCI